MRGVVIVAVVMSVFAVGLDRNQVVAGEANTALGLDAIRQRPRLRCRPSQDGCLQARVGIKVDVHGRHNDFVMVVLQLNQPLRQGACMMVIDIDRLATQTPPSGVLARRASTAWRTRSRIASDFDW
jgi:hypothetical protein